MTPRALLNHLKAQRRTDRLPAVFVGHGSPMNGVDDTVWARDWARLGAELPRPQAVLCVSAHWLTEGAAVHVSPAPKTIHDFYGFPREMYDLRYPCPGEPTRARETRSLLAAAGRAVTEDTEWGLDHGAWIVLRRMYPGADIPCFQLSIDATRHSAEHYAIGRELRALRDRGVLIVGSGNIVHNLGVMRYEPDAPAFDWAAEFDATVATMIEKGDHGALVAHETIGRVAQMSIPTPDHWWPLLYTLGAAHDGEQVRFTSSGIAHGSVSMRTVVLG